MDLKQSVLKNLNALIEDKLQREIIAHWAHTQISNGKDIEIDDKEVFTALCAIAMSDLRNEDFSYLYTIEDFKDWLEDFTKYLNHNK